MEPYWAPDQHHRLNFLLVLVRKAVGFVCPSASMYPADQGEAGCDIQAAGSAHCR